MNMDCLNNSFVSRIVYFLCGFALCMALYENISTSWFPKPILQRNGARNKPKHQQSEKMQPPTIPPWSTLPRTRFTNHVLELIQDYNVSASSDCGVYVQLSVVTPNSIPFMECVHEFDEFSYWCRALKRIFATRTLPYNITIGVKILDKFDPIDTDYGCIGSSSPNGMLTMPNLEVMVDMNQNAHDSPTIIDVPWEERAKIPIFRGTAWFPDTFDEQSCLPPENNISDLLRAPRFYAVHFSHYNPSLLDAKFSTIYNILVDCFANNATNGLDALLPTNYIEWEEYFSSYQVALVLPGIGAAFRLSTHLSYRSAVLLQDWEYEEWFTKYLTPFVNFIPLARDMSNLRERLMWILDHPKEVREIGENGRIFWEEYLTYVHNDEHIYEFVYRLSESLKYHDNLVGP
jgi:hypothetical protein